MIMIIIIFTLFIFDALLFRIALRASNAAIGRATSPLLHWKGAEDAAGVPQNALLNFT